MGVSWVFEYDKSAKDAERILEGGGAEHCGIFTVDCLPYTPKDASHQIQVNYVLHHSNFPQSSFSIAPAETFKLSPRAICDQGFDLILTKMSTGLAPDTAAKFEVTGNQYRLRDFVVRVGTASMATSVKGVVIEVEYEPSFVVLQCMFMMTELMQMFFPQHVNKKPEVISQVINKPNQEQYSALDTLYQYLTIFRTMRKKTQ